MYIGVFSCPIISGSFKHYLEFIVRLEMYIYEWTYINVHMYVYIYGYVIHISDIHVCAPVHPQLGAGVHVRAADRPLLLRPLRPGRHQPTDITLY
jgi:hypothetical protein